MPPVKVRSPDHCRKVTLVGMTLLLTLLYAGVIYGFPSMQLLMQRSNIYCENHCEPLKPGGKVTYENSKYITIVTVAEAVAAGTGMITGWVLDYTGPGWTVLMMGVLTVVGGVLMGEGTSYVAGYALMGFGGMGVLICAFRASYIFPEKTSFVISAISCLFDAASVVPTLFIFLNSTGGLSFRTLLLSWSFLGIAVFGGTSVMWFANPKFNTSAADSEETAEAEALLSPKPTSVKPVSTAEGAAGVPGAVDGEDVMRVSKADRDGGAKAVLRGFKRRADDTVDDEEYGDLAANGGNGNGNGTTAAAAGGGGKGGDDSYALLPPEPPSSVFTDLLGDDLMDAAYVKVADRPLMQQLKSPEFVYIFVFTLVHMFRNNLYFGATRDYYQYLDDAAHHDHFTELQGVIVPLGFLFIGLVGWIMDKYGFLVTGHGVNILGVFYGAFTCVPNLYAQLVAAFGFAFYRAMLFSFVAAYTAVIFGPNSVGRITGILYTSTAFFILLQAPLVKACSSHWFILHLGNTLILIIPIFLTFWLSKASVEAGPPPQDAEDDGDTSMYGDRGQLDRRGSFVSAITGASNFSATSRASLRGRSLRSYSQVSFSAMSVGSTMTEDFVVPPPSSVGGAIQ